MKRNMIFAGMAVLTGCLALVGILLYAFFYPKHYAKDAYGNYVDVTAPEEDTFPVTKNTRFVIEYSYPEEERVLTEYVDRIPALLGCDREGVTAYLEDYLKHVSYEEQQQGLTAFELVSYQGQTITLRKVFRPAQKDGFYAKSFNGTIVILRGDAKTVYEYTQIQIHVLPEAMQEKVLDGYYLEDEEALYSFLENYSS